MYTDNSIAPRELLVRGWTTLKTPIHLFIPPIHPFAHGRIQKKEMLYHILGMILYTANGLICSTGSVPFSSIRVELCAQYSHILSLGPCGRERGVMPPSASYAAWNLDLS